MCNFQGLVEIAPGFRPRPGLSHILFDFDGTLSLIRQGWPEIMVQMFVDFIPRKEEPEEELRRGLMDDIMRLNGKQTIYQMIQFAERVKERGGTPREPLDYKYEYLRRLDRFIQGRIEDLRSHKLSPDTLLVHGARPFLESLAGAGYRLYLASGTDEKYVKDEAALLDVARYFSGHIYGAIDDYRRFSKKMVIERILRENQIPGERLLAYGDGYVEIQNTKEAGGFAVAVASDEAHNGSGRMDAWKRARLMGVGADCAIPDFRDAPSLLDCILGKKELPKKPAAAGEGIHPSGPRNG